MSIRFLLLDVFIACMLDLAFGYPKKIPHPLRFVYFMMRPLEYFFLDKLGKQFLVPVKTLSNTIRVKTLKGKLYERFAGIVGLIVVLGAVFFSVFAMLYGANFLSQKIFGNGLLFHLLNIFFLFLSLASKSLANEVYAIFKALDERNLFDARKNLGSVISRETLLFNETEIVKATIETTAEQTVEGVISPFFYGVLGSLIGLGAPFALMYKVLSIWRTQFGVQNTRYLDFGSFAVSCYKVINWIPAWITGCCVILAAGFAKLDYKNSFRIFLRDRNKHPLSHVGYPQSAFAGALQVNLGGNDTEGSQQIQRVIIGDAGKDIIKNDIVDAAKLMYITFFVSMILLTSVGAMLSWFVFKNF